MKAVDEELNSMKLNNVWKVVKHKENVKPLKSKWVFKIKEDANGNPVHLKARLVVKGLLQRAGVDYDAFYAPVAELASIRIILAVGVQMKIHQLDVKTAFLHGELEKEIYMKIPEGMRAEP